MVAPRFFSDSRPIIAAWMISLKPRVCLSSTMSQEVDVASMALRHSGFGVGSAGTGREALNLVRRWHPHVMVLDVMLPDMDGFEVARRWWASMPRCRSCF